MNAAFDQFLKLDERIFRRGKVEEDRNKEGLKVHKEYWTVRRLYFKYKKLNKDDYWNKSPLIDKAKLKYEADA